MGVKVYKSPMEAFHAVSAELEKQHLAVLKASRAAAKKVGNGGKPK